MKRLFSIASLLFSLSLVVSLAAQGTTAPTAGMKITTDAEFATHMKEIQQQNGMLNKSMKGGMADEAAKAAARLEVLFTNIHGYWAAKKVEDAMTASQNVVTSVQAVQKALAANDMAAAETARAAIGANCMSCHKAHREKLPEGGFRIK